MIEEIKIDGILYKLIENCEENIDACDICDLNSLCEKHLGLVDFCFDLNIDLNRNSRNYYYKKQ